MHETVALERNRIEHGFQRIEIESKTLNLGFDRANRIIASLQDSSLLHYDLRSIPPAIVLSRSTLHVPRLHNNMILLWCLADDPVA